MCECRRRRPPPNLSFYLFLALSIDFFRQSALGGRGEGQGMSTGEREGLSTNNTDINSVLESSNPYVAKVEMKTAHPSKMQHVESWFCRGQSGDRYSEGRGLFEFLIRQLYSQRDPLHCEIRTTVYRGNNGRRRHLNSR